MLIEIVVALGLFGVLFTVLWTSYLSVYKTYVRETQKAHHLEQARQVVNFITDSFQRYESEYCQLVVGERGRVIRIAFQEKGTARWQAIDYNQNTQLVTFQGQEVAGQVSDFRASQRGDFYDFMVEVGDIRAKARVNLQYMDPLK